MPPPFCPDNPDPNQDPNRAPCRDPFPPANTPTDSGQKPNRRPPRFRRVFLGILLAATGLAAIFNQSLSRSLLFHALKLAAKSQGLSFHAVLKGNPFRDFHLLNLRLTPDGTRPSPIAECSVSDLHLQLQLLRIFSAQPEKSIALVSLTDTDLRLLPLPPDPRKTRPAKPPFKDLHRLLSRPLKTPGQLKIANFNLRSDTPPLQISNLQISLSESGTGSAKVESIQLPNMPALRDLNSQIQIHQGQLKLGPAGLAPEVVLERVEFNPVSGTRTAGAFGVSLRGFGGTAQLDFFSNASPAVLPPPNGHKEQPFLSRIHGRLEGIDLQAFSGWLHAPPPPVRFIEKAELSFSGNPELPGTWTTTAHLSAHDLALGPVRRRLLEVELKTDGGQLKFNAAASDPQSPTLSWKGTGTLPGDWRHLGSTEVDSQIHTAPGTSATLGGSIQLASGTASADLNLEGTDLQVGAIHAAHAQIRFRAKAQISNFSGAGPVAGPSPALSAALELKAQTLRMHQWALDSAEASVELKDLQLRIGGIQIRSGPNQVQCSGGFRLENPKKLWPPGSGALELQIEAPELHATVPDLLGRPVSGQLEGQSRWIYSGTRWNSETTLRAHTLSMAGIPVESLDLRCSSEAKLLKLDALTARFPGNGLLEASLLLPSLHPSAWTGNASLKIPDLNAVLAGLEKTDPPGGIRGKLAASWHRPAGTGVQGVSVPDGKLRFELDDFQNGGLRIARASLGAAYSPDTFDSSEFTVQSAKTRLSAQLHGSKTKLEIRSLALDQGNLRMLAGDCLIPILPTPTGWKPDPDAQQAAALHAMNLDMDTLAASLGIPSPVSGSVSASLLIHGTPSAPIAKFLLSSKNLTSKKLPLLAPAEIALDADYQEESMGIGLELRQRDTAPVALRGRSRILLSDILKYRGVPPDAPLDVTLRAPRISLSILPKVLNTFRRAEGSCAAELHLGGSITRPDLRGKLDLQADYLRLAGEAAPPVDAVRVQAALAGDTVRIQRADATLGGGRLEILGSLLFSNLARPSADLRLRCKDVLAHRTENLTVRVDSDLRLLGPIHAAEASGNLWLTHSKFSRDIEILPIGLPGRNRPRPKPAPPQSAPSFRAPPLRDCKLNIRILTRPEDPFRIRGNLAQGSANISLHLGGTGFHPELSGKIAIENFTASLPFSRLHVSSGQAIFSPDAPFIPQLDLHAESEIRDYRIYAHLAGTPENKKIDLTSEPPLDQNDIVSLLATGTTSAELNGNNDVLAGKAAVLVFQQLYRKVFKQRDPSEEQTLFDRLQIDIGGVDNRTGKQEISARFKLGDQFYLTGDVDVAGNFNGKIRYLLRYR
jgi:hypothetical protein